MIKLFDAANTDFTGNGNVVLDPVECSHSQAAAGKYDLTIRHPLDRTGKWMHIVPEAIIMAPVPEETIETAWSGLDLDVYKTTTAAALRTGPHEPTTITYPAWVSGTTYTAGSSKVSYLNHNYLCTQFDPDSGYVMVPPNNSPWWREIARTSPGDPVLVNLKAGQDLYFVSGPSSGWYVMSTPYGLEGYIKSDYIAYDRHLTPSETQPRTIREQLFRVRTVNVDTKGRMLTATAEHVSYDLLGVIVRNAKVVRRNPATALAWIEQEFMIDYQGTIATNMTADTDGLYSGEIKGKNGVFALLDPDQGVVAKLDAMYRRDNWDLFVMRKVNTDRGLRIRYRKNMLGVSWNIRSDQLVTRVVPVAKAENGDDLYLADPGWVDSTRINDYPVIRMEWIKVPGQVGKDDGTETGTNWTTTTLRAEMERKAQERFDVDKADQIQHEITIDFELLGDTDEYRQLKGLENVLLYDTVVAINEEIGMSVSVEVVNIEYDCIRKKVKALKLSNVSQYGQKNVSGFNVFNNSITGNKLTDDAGDEIVVEAVDIAVPEAVGQAKDYTNSHTKGYVGSYESKFNNYDESIKDWVTKHFRPVDS